MKPIEGIVIADAIKMAEGEVREAQTRQIASAIKDVMNKITNAKIKLSRSKSEVEANEKSLAGFEGQLKKIQDGDWSALPEVKEPDKAQESATQK